MPKSTLRLGKCKAGLSAKGNQMSTTDRCFARTWNMKDQITVDLLRKDMRVVNGGTELELGRDSKRRKTHIWWRSTGAG